MQPGLPKPVGRNVEPTIVYVDEQHATGILGNVTFSFSSAEPTHAFLTDWIMQGKKLIAQHERFACFVLIDANAKPPSDTARAEINRALTAFGGNLLAIAEIVEGKGFV